MAEVLSALRAAGVADKDIQTRAVSVQRLDWGDRKGQYQATSVVNVTVRNVDSAGAAVTAATNAGADLLSGPDLRMADPERAANAAYTAAYKAARSRAEAYAAAADMRVVRVLSIRDSGGMQGNRQLPGAVPVAPPPVVIEQASVDEGRIMAGQTTSTVAVQVDFALGPKREAQERRFRYAATLLPLIEIRFLMRGSRRGATLLIQDLVSISDLS